MMAIYNMRRFFSDDTSTCSAIYDPNGEHLCCALEPGPADRVPDGKYLISDLGIGPHDSPVARIKLGWNVIKGDNDAAYRIPAPAEVRDAQRDNAEAFEMFAKMIFKDDEIRIVS